MAASTGGTASDAASSGGVSARTSMGAVAPLVAARVRRRRAMPRCSAVELARSKEWPRTLVAPRRFGEPACARCGMPRGAVEAWMHMPADERLFGAPLQLCIAPSYGIGAQTRMRSQARRCHSGSQIRGGRSIWQTCLGWPWALLGACAKVACAGGGAGGEEAASRAPPLEVREGEGRERIQGV